MNTTVDVIKPVAEVGDAKRKRSVKRPKGRLVKGSAAAKRWMAHIRSLRKKSTKKRKATSPKKKSRKAKTPKRKAGRQHSPPARKGKPGKGKAKRQPGRQKSPPARKKTPKRK